MATTNTTDGISDPVGVVTSHGASTPNTRFVAKMIATNRAMRRRSATMPMTGTACEAAPESAGRARLESVALLGDKPDYCVKT